MSFGFIGLGNMGSMMSHNLASYAQSQGLPKVQIWNRTRSKSETLAANSYCEAVDSISDVVQKCNIIHTCLANDEVALSVYRELLQARKHGLILVDHSTLFPTTSTALEKEARDAGASFMSCPVFGPPAAAKSAGLLIVLSGTEEARQTVKSYIVPTLGKGVIDCGEDTSKGALLKILGNNCILGTIELLSESFTLAEKTGFDTDIFYEFIQQWFPAAAWVNYGKKIRDGAFSGKTGFTLPGGMKDAAYIRRLGAETSTPTPIIDQAWNHLTTAKAIGGESLDWSACAAGMRVTAGLKPFKGEDFSLQGGHVNGINGK
ncbi:hypothetical protein AYL99_04461 [Fonsecaea erecta]|uniref:6-phosphogluconate dehydrogenase NADP-binding domain-containing protein n=1 Tax=Fonsecaea erecta TaxID=1367422 RepID=A0A178ZQZ5_9EURO|nr:hypothetical protein AYL99_04461 [Fonsecaea erecta]OAP62258.1 hypothetical protein AYL99_04461 [Fonsecaea erecta]